MFGSFLPSCGLCRCHMVLQSRGLKKIWKQQGRGGKNHSASGMIAEPEIPVFQLQGIGFVVREFWRLKPSSERFCGSNASFLLCARSEGCPACLAGKQMLHAKCIREVSCLLRGELHLLASLSLYEGAWDSLTLLFHIQVRVVQFDIFESEPVRAMFSAPDFGWFEASETLQCD